MENWQSLELANATQRALKALDNKYKGYKAKMDANNAEFEKELNRLNRLYRV